MKQNIWFTSDWHLNHANILKYDDRPFSSIEEHDRAIINNFNSVVGTRDIVYHLGDLAFTKRKNQEWLRSILGRLKGEWCFLRGNHDHKKDLSLIKEFTLDGQIHDLLTINIEGQVVALCHYPIVEWDERYHGSWHIHGHDHNTWNFGDGKPRLNASIHFHNYFPVSWEQVKGFLNNESDNSGE